MAKPKWHPKENKNVNEGRKKSAAYYVCMLWGEGTMVRAWWEGVSILSFYTSVSYPFECPSAVSNHFSRFQRQTLDKAQGPSARNIQFSGCEWHGTVFSLVDSHLTPLLSCCVPLLRGMDRNGIFYGGKFQKRCVGCPQLGRAVLSQKPSHCGRRHCLK